MAAFKEDEFCLGTRGRCDLVGSIDALVGSIYVVQHSIGQARTVAAQRNSRSHTTTNIATSNRHKTSESLPTPGRNSNKFEGTHITCAYPMDFSTCMLYGGNNIMKPPHQAK